MLVFEMGAMRFRRGLRNFFFHSFIRIPNESADCTLCNSHMSNRLIQFDCTRYNEAVNNFFSHNNMCFWIVKVIHSQHRPPLIGVSSIQKETPSCVCQGLP